MIAESEVRTTKSKKELPYLPFIQKGPMNPASGYLLQLLRTIRPGQAL